MNKYIDFYNELKKYVNEKNVILDEPMKDHTSFKAGGPVDIMVLPENYEEIQKTIGLCTQNNVPYFIIGNGSNLLVRDKGIRGVVIKLRKLDKIAAEGNKLIAQSGVLLSDLSKKALEESLTGLEFACGIPGCIGGAVAMNAGAYNGEIVNVIESALVITDDGHLKKLSKDELELGYRMSAILKYHYTVLEATFNLEKGEFDCINKTINDLQKRREDKQPLEFASAGSTFKRPQGYFAGKLIEDAGLKGLKVGDAEVSVKHSGFIINKGNASASDILNLIAKVQQAVHDKFGVDLHPEVRIIGEE